MGDEVQMQLVSVHTPDRCQSCTRPSAASRSNAHDLPEAPMIPSAQPDTHLRGELSQWPATIPEVAMDTLLDDGMAVDSPEEEEARSSTSAADEAGGAATPKMSGGTTTPRMSGGTTTPEEGAVRTPEAGAARRPEVGDAGRPEAGAAGRPTAGVAGAQEAGGAERPEVDAAGAAEAAQTGGATAPSASAGKAIVVLDETQPLAESVGDDAWETWSWSGGSWAGSSVSPTAWQHDERLEAADEDDDGDDGDLKLTLAEKQIKEAMEKKSFDKNSGLAQRFRRSAGQDPAYKAAKSHAEKAKFRMDWLAKQYDQAAYNT